MPTSASLATAPSVAQPVRVAPPAAENRPERDATLGRERTLIEATRSALGRGDSAAALDSIDKHARDFPAGRLVEEREALAVQALMLAGRGDEARSRGERFHRRFPRSIFLPVVDAALEPGAPR
jgi:hypothetical protein